MRTMSMPIAGLLLAATVALPGLACAGGSQTYSDNVYGAETPEAAVTRFLEAANVDEYRLMANLFGTEDGPAERRWGRAEVEQRMFVLAGILHHDSFQLRRLNLTEGPSSVRVFADITGTSNGNASVPFITVLAGDRWYVQQILTETLSGGG